LAFAVVFNTGIALNGTAEAATADALPDWRLFSVGMQNTPTPQWDVNGTEGNPPWWNPAAVNTWVKSNSSYVEAFSAVCFLTVRDLMRMKGTVDVPVGLIFSAVPGTVIESWMSDDALAQCDHTKTQTQTQTQTQTTQGNVTGTPSLFNGMVAPFAKVSVRAVLWYQVLASTATTPLLRALSACT
jgi:hypothetical protein